MREEREADFDSARSCVPQKREDGSSCAKPQSGEESTVAARMRNEIMRAKRVIRVSEGWVVEYTVGAIEIL